MLAGLANPALSPRCPGATRYRELARGLVAGLDVARSVTAHLDPARYQTFVCACLDAQLGRSEVASLVNVAFMHTDDYAGVFRKKVATSSCDFRHFKDRGLPSLR